MTSQDDDNDLNPVDPAGADDAAPGFAPDDLTDGRTLEEVPTGTRLPWTSKYSEKAARNAIWREAGYLVGLLIVAAVGTLFLFASTDFTALPLPPEDDDKLRDYFYLALGGLAGGAVFAMKWLYHVVGHGSWHSDRLLWRLFVPLNSATFAFAFGTLVKSELVALFNSASLTGAGAWGFGFLVGYFSDTAIAKLAEVATTLFGTSEHHSGRRG